MVLQKCTNRPSRRRARQIAVPIHERAADDHMPYALGRNSKRDDVASLAVRGILVCGTGVGACIAANKIPGIRATVCHDIYSAHQSVEHDDVNVACIGAQVIGAKVAEDCLRAFLSASFSTEEQFRIRVAKLAALERLAAAELTK